MTSQWVLRKKFKFEASHQLKFHDGKCRRLHGHGYSLELEVSGPMIESGPKRGMVVDYSDITAAGKAVVDLLDHRHLNDVLRTDSPTAEFISRWIHDRVAVKIPALRAVTVCETEATSCRYSPAEQRLRDVVDRLLRGDALSRSGPVDFCRGAVDMLCLKKRRPARPAGRSGR